MVEINITKSFSPILYTWGDYYLSSIALEKFCIPDFDLAPFLLKTKVVVAFFLVPSVRLSARAYKTRLDDPTELGMVSF